MARRLRDRFKPAGDRCALRGAFEAYRYRTKILVCASLATTAGFRIDRYRRLAP
jgi:hypothetical protein